MSQKAIERAVHAALKVNQKIAIKSWHLSIQHMIHEHNDLYLVRTLKILATYAKNPAPNAKIEKANSYGDMEFFLQELERLFKNARYESVTCNALRKGHISVFITSSKNPVKIDADTLENAMKLCGTTVVDLKVPPTKDLPFVMTAHKNEGGMYAKVYFYGYEEKA